MIEAPVFVPYGQERLAVVVTVPDGKPRGLVALLQGLGAPRSHKYALWTRTARSLADHGIASLRMDYQTLGDSTGSLLADLHNPPIEEAETAVRHVMGILKVDAVAAVGNCMGGRTALELPKRIPSCVGVACILPGNLDAILPQRDEHMTGPLSSRARRLAGRMKRLKRAFRRIERTRGARPRTRLLTSFTNTLGSRPILLLYLGAEDSFRRLSRLVAPLPAGAANGVAPNPRLELIPAGKITSFRLPIDVQPKVVHALVAWLDETMPGPSPDEHSGARHASAAKEAAT